MSPIVYVPSKPHECKPPRQGELIPLGIGEEWYPEGTIWECDECARRWELVYEVRMGRTLSKRKGSSTYDEVCWRRVYY